MVNTKKGQQMQSDQDQKQAEELFIANKELAFQNAEKEKRAAELAIANKELIFQNEEKEKRAAELIIANKELAFQNAEKEKRAAELAIANKELAFQNKEKEKRVEELKQLNKLKDSFLFTTTHELKTPLVPIKAQAQLLLKGLYGPMNEKQLNAVKVIIRNADNLSRLSGDIFDFAKIKSGALIIHAEETSLEEILDDTIKDMEIVSDEKKVTLTLSPLPVLPKMHLDKGRIKQVLNNLIDNAFKFTTEGGKINIAVEKQGDNIKVEVKDSGIGISKENQEKLFTPFLQIDSSLSRKFSGTGLGLVVSKGIIEAHHGKIFAESKGEGKGSTFVFTLPIQATIK